MNRILSSLIFIFYWLMNIFLFPTRILRLLTLSDEMRRNSVICLEAGSAGWSLIEFKELYYSACEYIGAERVRKISIEPNQNYYTQVKAAVTVNRPSHYFIDPRTGTQRWFSGIIESIRICVLLTFNGITPIVLLADFGERTHRIQAVILTAFRGVVLTFVAQSKAGALFPHNRVIGPSLMPLSLSTLTELDHMKHEAPLIFETRALFVGSLYEPRTTFILQLADKLEGKELKLEIRSRAPNGARMPDAEYWRLLSTYPITVTTATQSDSSDCIWIAQFSYRYLEALISRTLLLAPEVPGANRYFIPGQHFVSYLSVDDAADKIEYYMKNNTERAKIALQGELHARSLIESKIYWLSIDLALGKHSVT